MSPFSIDMKTGVVVFPGSNCDHDAYTVAKNVLGLPTEYLWHKEHDLRGSDVIILPGGFSFGDYLRCGAIASHSPIMREVVNFANAGGIVMGICNGFQMLTEVGLLPGVLLRNESLRFVCEDVYLKVENHSTIFTSGILQTAPLRIPIAHGEGNYFAEADELKHMEDNNQILFRYVDENGNQTKEANPNGAINNIAGIINARGNVLGMMPHPERACDAVLGERTDGLAIFSSLVQSFAQSKAA